MINKPTRFPTNENVVHTLLNHVWTNKLSVLDSGTLEVDFTDHCPVYCRSHNCCDSDCGRVRTHFRDTSESQVRIFGTTLSGLDWSPVRNENIDEYMDLFVLQILQEADA